MADAQLQVRSGTAPLVRVLLSEYVVLGLSLLYLVIGAPFIPGFASAENLHNILLTLLPLFIVAVGQTVVLITGGIDLSQTSIIALCSITGAWVMNAVSGSLGIVGGVGTMLVVGIAVGCINGFAVAYLRMPAFIVTLTSMMFFSGFAIWLTRSQNIGHLPGAFNALGARVILALPLVGALAFGVHLMLRRSAWGRWLYATGHNARAAGTSGVPVHSTLLSAYAVSGALAAVASMLYTGQAESGSPVLAQKLLLDIVGATVIGGTSLFGGKGKVMWTLFGVLFLKLIDNSLNLLDLSYFAIMMVKGCVILLAAFLDTLRNRIMA